jgi:hypothetical protein
MLLDLLRMKRVQFAGVLGYRGAQLAKRSFSGAQPSGLACRLL